MRNRVVAVSTGALLLVSLGGISGAFAASQITSHDIKNQTIKSQDIHGQGVGTSELRNNGVYRKDLAPYMETQVYKKDLYDPTVKNKATEWSAPNDKTVVLCPAGAVALSGGYDIQADNQLDTVMVLKSQPTDDGAGWVVSGKSNVANADERNVKVTVVCASN